MTFLKPDNSLFSCRFASRLLAAAILPALSACGGGSDLACGAGTVQSGDQCVAKAAVKKDSGTGGEEVDSGADTGAPDAASDGGGAGGSGGTGGAGAGGGANEAGPTDEIDFGGITSASPANTTPIAGTAEPDSIRVTWAPAHFAKKPSAPIHYDVQFALTKAGLSAGTKYIAPPGSTSFNVEGLEAGKEHFFRVVAVVEGETAVDKVGPTKELSATPAFDDTAPTFNGASSAVANGAKGVIVKWKTPATDAQTASAGISYRVYWTDDPNGSFHLGAISAPGASEVAVNGLPQPEHPYYFKAIAVDAAGNVDTNTFVVQGLTGSDVTPPVFAGCLSASEPSATEATVSWAAGFDDTTPADQIVYKVYASDVTIAHDTPFSALQLVGTFTGGTFGRVTGLNAASTYRFICHATDAVGNEDDNRVIQQVNTKNDGAPPTFTGATKASPSAGIIGIDLEWPQAKDDQSANNAVVYNIYASSTAGGENYTKLPLTTATGGVLGKTITKEMLQSLRTSENLDTHVSNTTFYFVVRAQDETGNAEKNVAEVSATTLVSFTDDVQPIFSGNCAILICHTKGVDGTNPPIQGQDLDEGAAYTNIVNVVAREGAQLSPAEPNIKRIDGTSTNPHDSYLWRKINGVNIFGNQMPPPQAQRSLSDEQKFTIENWIRQGAPQN